jgi:cell division protein FtsL
VSENLEAERTVARAEVSRKAPARLTVFSVMSFAVIIGLMFMIVYSYVQLSELSEKKADMQDRLSELNSDYALLQADCERRISLAELETMAVERFGMVKPEQEQIKYVDLSGEDYAVVLKDEASGGDSFASAVSALFGRFVEYIR